MRTKGVPFGYLEFSRAKRRELCTYIRTCAHARRRWRRRPAGRCRSRSRSRAGLGSLPGLVLFESGPKDPLLLQTCWIANGCAPVGLPTVAHLLDNQRLRNRPLRVNSCDCWAANRHVCWDERVQPFVWVQTCWPLLECYIKHSKLSIETHQQQHQSSLLSLNSELQIKFCILNCKVEF